MSIDHNTLADLVARNGTVVRVVITGARGSTPREAGASLLVWQGGQTGSIGGGALEWQAVKQAKHVLAKGGGDWLNTIPLGPDLGQCCGGAVTLLGEVFTQERLTNLNDGFYLRQVSGTADVPLIIRNELRQFRNGNGYIQAQLTDGWLLEAVDPKRRPLWIYGAGHVGRALVTVLAPLPTFSITWVDSDAKRFPVSIPNNINQLVAKNPADTVQHAPLDAAHLILTYSHELDLEICHRLLGHRFLSAGLIGSATKWARFQKRLRELGHSVDKISKITCPIGEPKLGKHPMAIAIGVATSLLSEPAGIEILQTEVG